jgi:hypothetical protein
VRVDTGELKNSIQTSDAIDLQPGALSGSVGTSVGHAAPNEYGGPTIAARPSARQAAERARSPFQAAMQQVAEGR